MEGPSRGSWTAATAALDAALPGIDARTLAGEVFAIGDAVDANTSLRRALADPSKEAEPKRVLIRRLFGGQVSPQALQVVEAVAAGRWRTERDFSDALERLGVAAVFTAAEHDGVVDQVEDELFRFERLVAADQELARMLARSDIEPARRAELVVDLLAGRALPDTVWLAQRPVLHPRGQKFSAVIEEQLTVVSERRDQKTAVVTSAVELDLQQRERLAQGLERLYGHTVFVTVIVDPTVLGGLRVRIGDEIIDGTVVRKLDDARRVMGGS